MKTIEIPKRDEKPKPPADLWSQMDRVRSEAKLDCEQRPPGSVTIDEYAERYGVSGATAGNHLQKLERAGKLKGGKFCHNGKLCRFYVPL